MLAGRARGLDHGSNRPGWPDRSPLWESNPRPFPYHGNALPTELRGRARHSRGPVDNHSVVEPGPTNAFWPLGTGAARILSPAVSAPGSIRLRLATLDDAEAIAGIYNHEVEHTTATFDLVPRTVEEQQQWLAARSGAFCAVVALDLASDEVVGFTALSPYKERAAYRTSVEDSVYVRRDAHGRGIGRTLLNHALDLAEDSGFHAVMARIEATGAASRALHAQCGFSLVGIEREIGRKFNRWLDVALMQCLLHERS